jgi:hypothetical protein
MVAVSITASVTRAEGYGYGRSCVSRLGSTRRGGGYCFRLAVAFSTYAPAGLKPLTMEETNEGFVGAPQSGYVVSCLQSITGRDAKGICAGHGRHICRMIDEKAKALIALQSLFFTGALGLSTLDIAARSIAHYRDDAAAAGTSRDFLIYCTASRLEQALELGLGELSEIGGRS